jgi:outer membrane autotransporter protein
MKSKFPFFSRSALGFLTMVFPAGSHAAELQASDGMQYDMFGLSAAISGNFGLIGATDYGKSPEGVGSAYLFRNLDTASGTITQNATLIASDRMSGDYFGAATISGNIAIAGAFAKTIGENYGQGAAYVFRNLDSANGTITEDAKLIASDGGRISSFGDSVNLSGTNGLIGAPRNQVGFHFDQGSAYLFRNLDTVTGTVTEDVRLTASDGGAGDNFGSAVSLSGENGLVGASGVRFTDISMNQGAAYYFHNLTASGENATESAKLIASDGASGDYFGSAVSLSGTTALIGAQFAQVGSTYSQGAAYVFRNLDSAHGTVTEQVKLVASTLSPNPEALFGRSVSLSGNQALVGALSDNPLRSNTAPGAAYLYTHLDTATGVVSESVKITASDTQSSEYFGSSVALDGDRFVIGAFYGDGVSAKSGKAYTGTVSSLTTLDEENANRMTDGLSFISQTDWIIGKSSSANKVTLNAGDTANVTATGMGVYIGQDSGSDLNQLTIAGTLVTNGVQIGSAGASFGNNLTVADHGIVETGFIRVSPGSGNGLEIDGGTIRFNKPDASITGFQPGGIQLLDLGATFDTQDNSATIGTPLVGLGGLTKLGSGTLTLSGVNNYTGQTLVREGTLQLGDSSAPSSIAGDVQISQFASLSGNGTILGQLVNSGELAPGNSPGLIQVAGAYVQTHTGTLQIQITGEGYDHLITGVSSVLGGTLSLVAEPSALAFGQRYNLIQSASPITGGFDAINTSGFDGFREDFKIIGNAGILSIAPASYTQVATTPNEVHLAEALDPWIKSSDSDEQEIVAALDGLTAPEYRAAFASISPGLYEAALAGAVEQTQNQLSALANHLASRRLHSSDTSASDTGHDVWVLSTGVYAEGSLSSVEGDDFNSGGFLTGIEMQAAANFTAGLFTGSSESEGNFPGKNKIETDRYLLGAYATYDKDGFYANTALGGGLVDADVRRTIEIGGLSRTAHSDTDGREFFTMLAGGYDFHQGNWTFGPSGGLQYSSTRFDTIRENGAGALDLKIDNADADSLRGKLGGRVAYHHKVNDQLTLIPESRLFWQHEFLRDNSTLDAALNKGAGNSFDYDTADSDGDSVVGGLALGFQTNFGLYGNVSYDIELGREGEAIHSLSVGADWKF